MTKSLFGGYCNTVFHVVKAKIIRHINIFLHVETLVQIQISPNMSKMVQTVQMVPKVQTVQYGQNGPKWSKQSKLVKNGPKGPNGPSKSKMVQYLNLKFIKGIFLGLEKKKLIFGTPYIYSNYIISKTENIFAISPS